MDGRVGYAAIILEGDTPVAKLYGRVPNASTDETRQVAGELYAVGFAVNWLKKNGITSASIYYDYRGIEDWATGAWKAKKDLTQRYQKFIRSCGVKIRFVKVDAHTGNYWNEMADRLAKEGTTMPEKP